MAAEYTLTAAGGSSLSTKHCKKETFNHLRWTGVLASFPSTSVETLTTCPILGNGGSWSRYLDGQDHLYRQSSLLSLSFSKDKPGEDRPRVGSVVLRRATAGSWCSVGWPTSAFSARECEEYNVCSEAYNQRLSAILNSAWDRTLPCWLM